MIPPSLETKLNFLLQEMGGIEVAKELLTDKELVETCTYGDTVFVLQPYDLGKVILGAFNDDYAQDYDTNKNTIGQRVIEDFKQELYDLQYFGYEPDTYYYVLDKNFKRIYEDVCLPTRVNGIKSYFFGFSAKDANFTSNTPHGSLFYIYFQGKKGPALIRVILNAKPNPQKYSEYLFSFSKQLKNKNRLKEKEVTLRLPKGSSDVEIYLLPQSLKSNPSEHEIANSSESYRTYHSAGEEVYITVKQDIWVIGRYRVPAASYGIILPSLENKFLSNCLELLVDEEEYNYTGNTYRDLEVARDSSIIFYKTVVVNTTRVVSELKVSVDRYGIVEDVKASTYIPLRVDNVEGYGTEQIWFEDNQRLFISHTDKLHKPSTHYKHPLGTVKLTKNRQVTDMKVEVTLSLQA